LPQRRTGIKDVRQNRKRHMHNLDIKSDLKRTIKKFTALVKEKKDSDAKGILKDIYKKFDKAAKRHLIHDNTASRRKSYYGRLLSHISKA
jgi:small subunit ribosomal protein S20